jgi:hypothetical protein
MALTTSQKITLFEIIDTPYTGNVDEMYGKFGLSALTYEVGIDGKVQLKVLDRLTELTAEEEQKLLVYIDRWEAIGTNITSVDAGAFGTSSGMTFSADAELERIRQRVKNMVPVRHYWENVQQSAAESGSAGISISAIR